MQSGVSSAICFSMGVPQPTQKTPAKKVGCIYEMSLIRGPRRYGLQWPVAVISPFEVQAFAAGGPQFV